MSKYTDLQRRIAELEQELKWDRVRQTWCEVRLKYPEALVYQNGFIYIQTDEPEKTFKDDLRYPSRECLASHGYSHITSCGEMEIWGKRPY